MNYELLTETAPATLAALGSVVEVREVAYSAMREQMAAGEKPGEAAERLLGATLFVDGAPITFEGLMALPGRFSGGIADALAQTMRMHGLQRAATPPAQPAGGEGSQAPSDASSGPKA